MSTSQTPWLPLIEVARSMPELRDHAGAYVLAGGDAPAILAMFVARADELVRAANGGDAA